MEDKKQALREENLENKVFVKRGSFVFYSDWWTAIKNFPNHARLDIYDAIFTYAITGKTPVLKPESDMAFSLIKLMIDRDFEKYENICERNRLNVKRRWDSEENTKNTAGKIRILKIPNTAKNTDNDNDNDNDIIISEKSAALFAAYQLWFEKNAAYCSNSEKFKQLTENELWQLTNKYGVEQIKNAILNLEKKKNIRNKYTELYKVLSDYLEKINRSF